MWFSSKRSVRSAASAGEDSLPSFAGELDRADQRRKVWGLRQMPEDANGTWALCLSGGGIRSATFCLGVLQGLSRTPSPENLKNTLESEHPELNETNNLLAQFDFLSTVSGGGYIGSFFSSLFVPGRLSGHKGETDAVAARRAYQALQEDPPQRMHTKTTYRPAEPGAAALAWLRDNGRYLTPTGGGDLGYAAAIAIRNWFSVHFVIATVLLSILSLSLLLRVGAVQFLNFHSLEGLGYCRACMIVWSSTWYAVAAVVLGMAFPFGISYWFAHPGKGGNLESKSRPFTAAWWGGLLLVIVCLGMWHWGTSMSQPPPTWASAFFAVGALTSAGCAFFSLTHWLGHPKNVSGQRVLLSRWLTRGLMLALALGALALVETLSLSIVHLIENWGAALAVAGVSTGSGLAVIVWSIRAVAKRLPIDVPKKSKKKIKLPFDALAALLAALLWVIMATALGALLLWLHLGGHENFSPLFSGTRDASILYQVGWGSVVIFLIAVLVGLFPGFVNLSTYQPFYSARLTRAYLGASNNARFAGDSAQLRNVAEPAEGDMLKTADLYRNPLAPIHFINVCLNQTAGPEGQLVQRDRKGKPLATSVNGFYVDGKPYAIKGTRRLGDLSSVLTVGEWIGVSGAAVSTGLGRATSLGTSLLLGFANVRLGRWWPHGIDRMPSHQPPIRARYLLASQRYLFDEFTAKFEGLRLNYGYLSDGGHFENTAAYEMLRPQRRVQLLVVCDCGADPDYLFGDLANLVRLVRIDHRLDLRVNTEVLQHPKLKEVFGTPESFRRDVNGNRPVLGRRCAVLLDVLCRDPDIGAGMPPGKLLARIVLIKPVLLEGMSVDVANYGIKNEDFPQQTTGDQFFDEAQWESYRSLGFSIATQLFPQRNDEYSRDFWSALTDI